MCSQIFKIPPCPPHTVPSTSSLGLVIHDYILLFMKEVKEAEMNVNLVFIKLGKDKLKSNYIMDSELNQNFLFALTQLQT